MSVQVMRSAGPDELAEAVAQRLQRALAAAQSDGRVASLCLTGPDATLWLVDEAAASRL